MERRLLLVVLFASVSSFASVPSFADSPGSTGAEVLKFGAGPRAYAMGGAQTALVTDVFSLNLNPGGLAALPYQEASFVYNAWVEGVTQQTLLYARPDPRWGSFGLGLTRFDVGNFQGYDASGHKAGTVDQQDTVFTAGYGRPVGEFGVGGAVKFLQEKLDTATAWTYAVDLGAQAHTEVGDTRLRGGVVFQNYGPGLKFDRDTTKLPAVYKLGVSATRDLYGDPCSLTFDVGQPRDQSNLQSAVGAEAGIKGVLALRLGYQTSIDLGSGFSFGLGVKAQNVHFDYAFLLLGAFGPTHRFGVTLKWGEPMSVSRDRERLAEAAAHKVRAREYAAQKRYLESLEEYNRALELDPLDKDTIAEMRQVYDALHR